MVLATVVNAVVAVQSCELLAHSRDGEFDIRAVGGQIAANHKW
jgi:hypothetical protein